MEQDVLARAEARDGPERRRLPGGARLGRGEQWCDARQTEAVSNARRHVELSGALVNDLVSILEGDPQQVAPGSKHHAPNGGGLSSSTGWVASATVVPEPSVTVSFKVRGPRRPCSSTSSSRGKATAMGTSTVPSPFGKK